MERADHGQGTRLRGSLGGMDTSWATGPLGTGLLIGATLATGLTAGLLFAFAHSVMPGLRALSDRDYLHAFQRIDAAIANPWMGLAFLGSPLLTLAALVVRFREGGVLLLWLVLALALIAVTIVITVAVNLPLNAQVQAAAPGFADASALRSRFEARWVTWNVIRTVTSVAAFCCLALALPTGT